MKKFYFFVLLVTEILHAQVVTTEPQFPTENDSVVVYLDATQPGAEELLNYAGTIYAHTGVHTNLGDWQHVIGEWGNNSTQPALTRLGTNSYQLTIGYPRQFYSVTNPSEQIETIALVFRSADGTIQTRPDIFVEIFEPGVTVVINNPVITLEFGDPLRSPAFASQDDTLDVDITAVEVGTNVVDFTLQLNGVQVAQTGSNQINYDFISAEHLDGANEFLAVAEDMSGEKDSTEFIIFVNPPIDDEPLPAGKEYGINYDNSTA
ncbi:MAG: hypothetical protein EHM47_16035, partial [Ignavibacteriales bacterium]